MPVDLSRTSESDLDSLMALFTKAFKLQGGEPLLNPDLLRWKYFDPRPDWEGPRSYILHSGPRTMAHACLCPMPFRHHGELINAILLVDWLSVVPGAGAEIYRRFYPLCDAVFGNGGSTKARKTIEELKYPVIGSVGMYSRPLKPWAMFQQGKGGAKNLLRLARNTAVSASPLYSSAGWTVEPVAQFGSAHQGLCDYEASRRLQTLRSPELLNYFLRCPLAPMTGYVVRQNAALRGYFILGDFGSDTKLVDLRISSEDLADWSSVISLVAQTAARLPAPLLLITSTLPLMNQALEVNRFRRFEEDPLYLYDPEKKILGEDLPLHITPFDGDQAYQ